MLPLLIGGAAAFLLMSKKKGEALPSFNCPVCHVEDDSFRSESECERCEAHHEHMKVYYREAVAMKRDGKDLHERCVRSDMQNHEGAMSIGKLRQETRARRNEGLRAGFVMGAIFAASMLKLMGVLAQ
jgi:hypothetical protein